MLLYPAPITLQIKLIQLPALPPSSAASPTAKQELQLARECAHRLGTGPQPHSVHAQATSVRDVRLGFG